MIFWIFGYCYYLTSGISTVRKRHVHGATFLRWKAQMQVTASLPFHQSFDILNSRLGAIRSFSRVGSVLADSNEGEILFSQI